MPVAPAFKLKKKHHLSAVISGALVLFLMLSGGVIAYSQVFKSQDLASQAASGDNCRGVSAGTTKMGTPGTMGCAANETPLLSCTPVNSNGIEYGRIWARKECVKQTPTCNSLTGRPNDCPCESTKHCASGRCETTQSYGPKKCVSSSAQLTGSATKPTTPTTGGTKPATNTGTGTAPATGNTNPAPAAPAAPAAVAPTQIIGTPPTCEVLVGTKSQSDAQIAQSGKPATEEALAKYFVPSISTNFNAGEYTFYCSVSGGPVKNVHWALYRVSNNSYSVYKYGSSIANSSLLDTNKVILQQGDHFECLPTYIDASGTEVNGQKCVKTLR